MSGTFEAVLGNRAKCVAEQEYAHLSKRVRELVERELAGSATGQFPPVFRFFEALGSANGSAQAKEEVLKHLAGRYEMRVAQAAMQALERGEGT